MINLDRTDFLENSIVLEKSSNPEWGHINTAGEQMNKE
jgi:hypothetical protein